MKAVDTNVLVCAHRAEMAQHPVARAVPDGLVVEHGVTTLITGDRRMRRFDGVRTQHPFD